MEKWSAYLHIATAVCTLAAAIAALTPTPTDDGVVALVRKVVDLLAFNWGHARNVAPARHDDDDDEVL